MLALNWNSLQKKTYGSPVRQNLETVNETHYRGWTPIGIHANHANCASTIRTVCAVPSKPCELCWHSLHSLRSFGRNNSPQIIQLWPKLCELCWRSSHSLHSFGRNRLECVWISCLPSWLWYFSPIDLAFRAKQVDAAKTRKLENLETRRLGNSKRRGVCHRSQKRPQG